MLSTDYCILNVIRYAVAQWCGAGLAIAGSNPPTSAVYQRKLSVPSLQGSVNEYQRKLGSKRAYHVMH